MKIMNFTDSIKKKLWDVDLKSVDLKKNQNFLITRITEKGNQQDIIWLMKNFSKSVIKKTVKNSKNTSEKTKSFWKIY